MYEDKMGFNQHLMCDDPDTRQGCLNWMERVLGGYGADTKCVDLQIIEGQLILNEKTRDYIYSEFTSLELKYQEGSRPFLEKVLAEVVDSGMSEKEKVLAIMRRCRDNRDGVNPNIKFGGGSEEDLVKRGAIMCNEISRVFVVLCQMAGIPARVIGCHIAGHMMSECYLDGKWCWFDSMKGMYAQMDDGPLASFWELWQEPEIIDRQPDEIVTDHRPIGDPPADLLDYYRKKERLALRACYCHPKEAVAVGNYFVWDHARYDYPWDTGGAVDRVRTEKAVIAENTMRVKFGYPMGKFLMIELGGDS